MSLAGDQQAMLDAVFGRWDEAALRDKVAQEDTLRVRGLQAYRSNGHALAQRALAGTFPVTLQMLGQENFEALARAFWHASAPEKGDIAQWGIGLPEFISTAPQLAEEPQLPDVARVEWALHAAATATDIQPDPTSFALLMEQDPALLALLPASGLCVVDSLWPVVTIINAHLTSELSLDHAAQRLRDGVGEAAVIWRQGFKPMLREAMTGEAAFLAAVLAGLSLGTAPDAALESNSEFDFNQWLAAAVQSGLIAGATPIQPEEKT